MFFWLPLSNSSSMGEKDCVATLNKNLILRNLPLKQCFCCLFSSYLLHLLSTGFFSSSGAKQNAGGGCHRQIKSLLLMHCSDMEKIDAAPQHRLQLNLEEKSLEFLMNKTNNSLYWWLLSLICCRAGGPKWGETPRWPTLLFCRARGKETSAVWLSATCSRGEQKRAGKLLLCRSFIHILSQR